MKQSVHEICGLKPIVFVIALFPIAWIAARIFLLDGSANPIQEGLHNSGEWALLFLLLSLSITPIRKVTNIRQIKPYRRMFGLFSFFYASLHLVIYLGIEHFFDWTAIFDDITRHKRILVGMAGYIMLLPLALTSFKHSIKWLGAKRWRILHTLSYPAAISAVLHYLWLVKADTLKPLLYGIILLILLGYRVIACWFTRSRSLVRLRKHKVVHDNYNIIHNENSRRNRCLIILKSWHSKE